MARSIVFSSPKRELGLEQALFLDAQIFLRSSGAYGLILYFHGEIHVNESRLEAEVLQPTEFHSRRCCPPHQDSGKLFSELTKLESILEEKNRELERANDRISFQEQLIASLQWGNQALTENFFSQELKPGKIRRYYQPRTSSYSYPDKVITEPSLFSSAGSPISQKSVSKVPNLSNEAPDSTILYNTIIRSRFEACPPCETGSREAPHLVERSEHSAGASRGASPNPQAITDKAAPDAKLRIEPPQEPAAAERATSDQNLH